MGKRLNIGIDVDGVVSDFLSSARTLLKELFDGKPADNLVQTSWAFESLGISKKEENIFWRRVDEIPNWWLTHKPMPGTDLLTRFADKHRVVFITNRKDGTGWPIEDQTAQWLKRNFCIWNPIVVISDKKGPVAEGLKLDYFIDDRPKNVEEVMQESPETKSFLCNGTYNQDFDGVTDIFSCEFMPVKRVDTLNEFIQIVEGQ